MKRSSIFILLITIIFAIQKSYSQDYLIWYLTTPYKYFAATEEPDADWYMPGFDDSSWAQDTGTIGFGYSGLNTPVDENTSSLYLRYKFYIENKEWTEEINISADYDDGYIAYLNGKEILRINISDTVSTITYNNITERSHERVSTPYSVLGYYFDSPALDSLLVEGENTLAIHVLNDSIDGSDLYFRGNLYDVSFTIYNLWSDIFRYKRKWMLDSTDFPLVVINTDEYGIPHKHIRVKAYMGIIDNGPGNFNHPDDSFNIYEGDISIEVRGQSSGEFPKQSYRFETIHTVDTVIKDTNVVLLDMPVDNDWILFGPFTDKSQIRNKMVYDLGTMLGSYQTRSKFCELIINGEYLGLYRLSETIKRDENRVNIKKLREEEISGTDLTGGYIMRYDKGPGGLQIVYPKEDKIQPEQTEYINSFVNEYNSVLFSNDFMDPDIGFRKYICDSSLVNYLIINELTKNADAYIISTYFYKDRADVDNRIKFGPLWDYDLAFGNTTFQEGNLTYNWQFEYNTKLNITRIMQDEDFAQLFMERWNELREGPLHTDSLLYYIDSLVSYIEKPRERNYNVWPVIDDYLFFPNYVAQTYEEEIQTIKDWLTTRVQWIDENIDQLYYPVVIYNSNPVLTEAGQPELIVFPNPFTDKLFLAVSVKKSAELKVEFSNLLGQVMTIDYGNIAEGYSEIRLDNFKTGNLISGVYVMRIFLNNKVISSQKIIKK